MTDEDLLLWLSRNQQARKMLEQLFEARQATDSLKCGAWPLAVEMATLLEGGVTITQLRMLVWDGCVDHAEEVTIPSDPGRTFNPGPRTTFGPKSCFILTDTGKALVGSLEEESDTGRGPRNGQAKSRRVPRWSATARELKVDGQVLKRFRRPAPNLELILAAFEEEGWSRHIDDPLPPEQGIDPQQRLRDTVRRLNGCQEPFKIIFESNGWGSGIQWRWAERKLRNATDEPRMGHG